MVQVELVIADRVLEQPGRRIRPALLHALEARLGFRLPSSYKAFLLLHNDCVSRPNLVFTVPSELIKCSDLHDIYAVQCRESYKRLWSVYCTTHGLFPKHFVAAACDSGGAEILVCCAGRKQGHVFYWDNLLGRDTTKNLLKPIPFSFRKHLYYVASDWWEFLGGLRPFEPTNPRVPLKKHPRGK